MPTLDRHLPSAGDADKYLVVPRLDCVVGWGRQASFLDEPPEERVGVEEQPQASSPYQSLNSSSLIGSIKRSGTFILPFSRPGVRSLASGTKGSIVSVTRSAIKSGAPTRVSRTVPSLASEMRISSPLAARSISSSRWS